jgi:hypothetical protein
MERLRHLLMRAAFRDPGGNLWQRLRRSLARRLLGAEAETWRRGLADVRLRPQPARLSTVSRELIRRRELQLAAAGPAARFAPTPSLGPTRVESLRVAPQEVPQPEPDYEMDEWLAEVTEPYILWDAPKPEFGYLADYFYDDAEALPELGLPPRTRLWSRLKPARDNAVLGAFSDLRKQARLFTLPPDQLVRKRTSQTV